MASALSGHILESYYALNSQSSGPFGRAHPWPSSSNSIVTSSAMSFDPDMHGNSQPMKLVPDPPEDETSFMNLSKSTAVKIAALQAKLNQQLGPEYISTRPGPGGGPKLVYAEGWKIINLANEVFGFNGWSSNLVSLTTDFIDYNEETRRYSTGVTAIVRVTLRDGVFHEDIGYGLLENSKTKGPALDKCKKEAVTDGLKRCLRNFGNLLGNCLYDKQYTNEIVKIKVNPPKFDKENLHRRPEYTPEVNKSSSSSASKTSNPTAAETTVASVVVKTETVPPKPLSSIPPHVRESVRTESSSSPTTATNTTKTAIPITENRVPSANASTPGSGSSRGSVARHAAILHGLNTPIATPAGQAARLPPQQGQPMTSNRQVAFADSPLANRANTAAPAPVPPEESLDEDSFAFGSEDEAFFATVDLGEVDLGRPIDFAEGTRGRGSEDEAQSVLSTDSRNAQTTLYPSTSSSSHAMNSSTSSAFAPTKSVDPDRNQQQKQASYQAQRPVVNPPRTSDPVDRPAQSGSGSGNASSVAATSTPAPRRMGGFSFPPNVLDRQPQQTIGVKRPAEAMSRPSANTAQGSRDRRLAPGMGLTAHGGGMHRQQLNSGQDGVDVKRTRY